MRFAAEKRSCDEVEAGALWRIAKDASVEEINGEKMKLRAREGTDFSGFWNADEGAAKAKSVGENCDSERDSQSEQDGARQGGEKRIVAVSPESLADAQEPDRRQQIDGELADACELAEERSNRKAGGEKRDEEKRDQKADVERDSPEERVRQQGHEQTDHGKDSEEAECAGEDDGSSVASRELQEHSQRDLRTDDGYGEEDETGGVHVESERGGEQENGGQIAEKNSAQRNGQRNDVGVIAAVEEESIPAPNGGGAGDDHGKDDEEIFIGHGGDERVEDAVAAHPANERTVFFKE